MFLIVDNRLPSVYYIIMTNTQRPPTLAEYAMAKKELETHIPNRFEQLHESTTLLVLNVMERCARSLHLNINDDEVADKLYWICCDLESWPEDHGFGSSDHYSYIQAARKQFGIAEEA